MVSKSNRKSRDDRDGNNSVRKSDISKKLISPVDASAETGPPSLRRSTRGAIQREEITSTSDTKAQSGKESTSERPNTRDSADLSKKDAPPPVKRKSEVKASVSAAKTQPEKISTTAHSNVKNTTEFREKDSLLPAKRKLEVPERKKVLSSPLRRSARGKIQLPLMSSDTNNNRKVSIIDVPEKDTPPPAKRKLKVLEREKVSSSPLRRSEGGNKQPPLLSSDTNNNRKVTVIDVLEKDTPPPAKRKFKVLEREKVSPNPLRRSERGKKQPSLMFSDTNNNGKVTVMKNVSMKKQKREKNLEELALEDKETNKEAKEEEKSNGRKRKTANASMYKLRFRQQELEDLARPEKLSQDDKSCSGVSISKLPKVGQDGARDCSEKIEILCVERDCEEEKQESIAKLNDVNANELTNPGKFEMPCLNSESQENGVNALNGSKIGEEIVDRSEKLQVIHSSVVEFQSQEGKVSLNSNVVEGAGVASSSSSEGELQVVHSSVVELQHQGVEILPDSNVVEGTVVASSLSSEGELQVVHSSVVELQHQEVDVLPDNSVVEGTVVVLSSSSEGDNDNSVRNCASCKRPRLTNNPVRELCSCSMVPICDLQETFISENVAEYARPDDSLDVDVNDGNKSTHPIHELGDEMMFDATKFVEYWVPVSMSNVQLEQYCATLLSNSTTLRNSSSKDIVGGALQEIIISIKKSCDHPYNQDSGLQKLLTKDLLPVEYLDVGIEASGKLHFLDILLSEIRSRGKRVLILYQSRSAGSSTGDILDDFLRQRFGPDSYERIEKDILKSKKQAALNLFNDKGSGRFVFLLEKRACSPTLKLSAVNAVLVFDSDWNLMNDNIALDKLSIDPSPEPLKIFRLYTSCTLEEKVLDLATNHVSLDSNLQNIRRMTSHMLLMWGASYIFRRLDRFHGIRDASQSGASLCSDISMLKDVVDELLGLLTQNAENSCKSSLITKVRHNGVKYDNKGPLFGQSKVQSTNGKEPHQFWNELLEQKNPHWRFLSGCSQRNRKSAQDFGDLPKKPDDGPGDLTKKQKNFLNRSVDAPPLPKTGLIEGESPAITEEAQKVKSWLKIKSSGELSGSQFYDGQENIGLISGTCQTSNRTEMTKVETIPVTTAREKVGYGVTIGYETVTSQSLCATITIEAQVGNLGGPSDVSVNAVVCNLPPISEQISDEAFCARKEDTTAPHKFPVSAKSLEASDLDVEFNRVNKEIIGINILDSDLVENDTEDNITDRENVGCGVTTENPIISLRSLGGTDPGGASDAQEANVNAPNEVVGDIKSLETSIPDGGDNAEFSDTNLSESVLVEKSSYAPSYALEENVTSPNEVVGVVKSLETSNPDGGDNTGFSDAYLSDSVPVEKSACALPYAQEVNVTTSNEVVGVVKSSETSNPDGGDNTEFIDTNSSEPVLVENSTYTSDSTRHDGNFCTESPLVRSHVKQIIKNRSEDAVLSHKFAPPVQCHRPLTSASILDEDVTSCENTTNVLEQAEVEQLHLITAEFRQADSSTASLVSRDGCTRAYESYNVTDVIESWTTFAPSNPELAELELPHVEHLPSQNREQSATQSDPNMLPSLPTQTVEEVLDRDDSQVGISPSIDTPVVGFRAHYPSGQARQVDLQAQSQLLLSDPLKFESDRLFKEGEKAAKCSEDAKQQLRIEYEKEKEEVIAEIHRKYVAKVKDADADYLLKKKELDVIRRKVLMNRILAEAFTTKCLGGKPSMSSVPSTSFLHQVLLLSAQSQRTSAVSVSPKFVPPVPSQQTAPSFAAHPPSPAIGNRQMRPPHMLPNTRPNSNFPIPSDIRARNLPISGEILSRAPHLQPSLPTAAPTFRPASQGLSGLYPQRHPSTTAQVLPRVLTQLPQQPVPTPLPHTKTMGFRNPSVPAVRLFNGENLPRACAPNVLPSALNADINLDALYLLQGGVQCGGKVGRGVNFASSSVITEVVCLSDDE